MASSIQLSIIIVNYNVCRLLEQCLLSVRGARGDLQIETFVVDNASTDGSIPYLQERFPEVIFIANRHNPGFSVANNQAIRQAQGKYILLLNPDTILGEDTLTASVQFLEEHPQTGSIGVKMINANGEFLPESKRSFPSPWNAFCKMLGLSRLFPGSRLFARYQLRYLSPDKIHEIEVLSGAYMMMRYEALQRVGLLDEQFFMYGEDIDLSYRIVAGGYRCYYLPVRMLHYKGESTKKSDIQYYRNFYGAMLIFFRKYYPHSSFFVAGAIRLAIYLTGSVAAVPAVLTTGKKPLHKVDNLLIIGGSADLDGVLWIVSQRWECRQVYKHEIDGTVPINLPMLIKSYRTVDHVLFCIPTLPYREVFEQMDVCPDKTITYHFYHVASGQIISPKQ